MDIKNKRHNAIKIVFFIVLLFTVSLLLMKVNAYGDDGQDIEKVFEQQVQSDNINMLEDALRRYSAEDINKIITHYNPQDVIEDVAKGKFQINIKSILNKVLTYFLSEIYQNAHIMLKLVLIVILCAILKNLQTSFLSDSVGELAFYACYMVVVSIMLVSFNSAINLGLRIIDNMIDFMYATVPILITLLISGGGITSGGVFQPMMIMVLEISAVIFRNILIPIVFLSTILSIVSNISDKVHISRLADLMKQISGWTLGLILTIFIAIISIQGSLGAVVDGVTSKTAKFAIGAFIPVAGGYLADAADTVIGCALLIKNAAGVAAMVGIVAICLVPTLKMVALIVLYKLTCALMEPISEKRITNCINQIAGSLTFIVGIAAAVAFMFLISITAIISAGSVTAAIR